MKASLPGNPAKARRIFPGRSELPLTTEMLTITWRWHLLSYWGRRRRNHSHPFFYLATSFLEALWGERVLSPGAPLPLPLRVFLAILASSSSPIYLGAPFGSTHLASFLSRPRPSSYSTRGYHRG